MHASCYQTLYPENCSDIISLVTPALCFCKLFENGPESEQDAVESSSRPGMVKKHPLEMDSHPSGRNRIGGRVCL